MVRYLHSRGVLTKVRNSAGQDVDGGCGQLRARATELIKVRNLDRKSPSRPALT
jgi:23S rRNA (adenine2503-C2)-methyltransferase